MMRQRRACPAVQPVIFQMGYAWPMRLSGKLKSWNDDRGFGFIAPATGEVDVFLHISALPKDGTRPTVGEKVTYELGVGKNGKPQALNVIRVAFGDTRKMKSVSPIKRNRSTSFFPRAIGLIMVIALGAYGYKHYAQRVSQYSTPSAALTNEVHQTTKPDENPTGFKCDGRTYCSQMTSCTEAKFFLKNCPGTKMDGNNDGTPCEQQWCTSPFAK
jgi:cold shock CspA family protein